VVPRQKRGSDTERGSVGKLAVLFTTMLVAMMIAVPIAYAAQIQCRALQCNGTLNRDLILERRGNNLNDSIFGRAGSDRLRAGAYTSEVDRLNGQRGNDILNAMDDDWQDSLNGGPGYDRCTGDIAADNPGDQFLNCEVINGVPE